MARILIIDDEPGIIELLTTALEQAGFQTTAALSGEAGLCAYQVQRPDAVLLDLVMPTMDGISTLTAIRRLDPSARVAVLSAVGTRAAVQEALAAGAQDFVLKPFDLDRVLTAVEGLLGGQQAAGSV